MRPSSGTMSSSETAGVRVPDECTDGFSFSDSARIGLEEEGPYSDEVDWLVPRLVTKTSMWTLRLELEPDSASLFLSLALRDAR